MRICREERMAGELSNWTSGRTRAWRLSSVSGECYNFRMPRLSRACYSIKWVGTIACLLLVTAFLYSTRRAIMWHSPRTHYEVSLLAGGIAVGWRAPDWRLETERYPCTAGWSVASYGGPEGWTTLTMGIHHSSNRSWKGIGIALWIPFLPTFLLAATLWYLDRTNLRNACQRWGWLLRPTHRRRITLWLVLLCIVLHTVGVIVAVEIIGFLLNFFVPLSVGRLLNDRRVVAVLMVLFWGSPIWGACWAWMLVRFRNGLLVRFPGTGCIDCGYDLTGNTSGRCPECGSVICVSAKSRPVQT